MGIPTDKISNRILVFFSCWCLLALPIHYFTCSVERNSIPPLDSVLNKKVVFPIQINVYCISKTEGFCVNAMNDASDHIKQQYNDREDIYNRFKLNIAQYKLDDNIDILTNCESSYNDVSYLSCLQSMSEQTENQIATYDVYLIHNKISSPWIVSPYRSAWININDKTNKNMKEELYILMDKIIYAPLGSSKINIGVKDQIFSFTLLNSEPERGYNFEWNMNEIYSNYLLPFFNRIGNILIYDYHIDSQILHYGYIISQPPTDDIHVDRADFASILANYIQKDRKDNYYYVTNKELETFVGGTDWNRISSLINDIIPIQFMIYIPPKKYSPLHIKSSINDKIQRNEYDAFLVPRFGGCIIYNPLLNVTTKTAKKRKIKINTDDLYPTFNLVLSQLRLLLGLRNDYNFNKYKLNDKDMLVIMDETGINDWELDILIRWNIISDLETVEIALKNIYEMIDQVSQLPIKLDVASLISDAVYAFDEALRSCNKDNNYIECIQWTRHSNYLAKKAEYHPSMLPALYFSPEFTYAVYSPYFLPGYIPILAAVIKKLKAKYQEWRNKGKEEKTDDVSATDT